jgi:dephospho-CoA kinase
MKIAITGNIGSGKSTFANFAQQAGYPVFYADQVSKNILDSDENVKSLIEKEFGKDALKNGKPNKTFLAQLVFSDPEKLKKLESILHPKVIKETKKFFQDFSKTNKAIFVEAALIYEADMENMFDYVVLITSERNLRLERKVKSGLNEQDFNKRESNQISEEEKKKRADFIFSNNLSKEELKIKFNLLLITLGI